MSKLNLITWTALALFTATIIISGGPSLCKLIAGLIATGTCVFIISFHLWLIYMTERANMLDRKWVYKMDCKMLELIDVNSLEDFRKELGRYTGHMNYRLIFSQIGITLLFSIATCFAVWFS